MANVSTEICNLALSHLAVSVDIANLETERTRESLACRRFYDQVRDEVLRDFDWPFARRRVKLALVEERPNTEWMFAYRMPANCLKFRRIVGMLRNEAPDQRIPFALERDDEGLLILSDHYDAEGVYTSRELVVSIYPPDFVEAMSLLLASYIAPRVTAGDQFRLGQQALQKYAWRIQAAQANAMTEEQRDLPPESELLRARY